MKIESSDSSFDYDIRSLVRAFFPRERIEFLHYDDKFGDVGIDIPFVCGTGSSRIIIPRGDLSRAELKNEIKRRLYDVLSDITSSELPWGTLTGIRPTKPVLRKLREGNSREEIFDFMRSVYYVSDARIALSYDIALREYELADSLGVFDERDSSYSLYVGIPFCPSICLYCSFSSYPIGIYGDRVEDYLAALRKEIDFVADDMKDRRLISIYMGGGTPTSLSEDQLKDLLAYMEERLELSGLCEWTIEAGRPDSLTPEKLRIIKDTWGGGLRISINPQTMNDDTLKLIGRNHTAADIERTFEEARSAQIASINMDMIVGLPKENEDSIKRTLEKIMRLAPDNLTVHSLAIKRASRLHELFSDYRDDLGGNGEHIMQMVHDAAAALSMKPYYLYRQKDIAGNLENIGFATEGREGIYNILIMEELQDIVALGAGAACKRLVRNAAGIIDARAKVGRCENVKDVDQYISRTDEMIDRKRELFLAG